MLRFLKLVLPFALVVLSIHADQTTNEWSLTNIDSSTLLTDSAEAFKSQLNRLNSQLKTDSGPNSENTCQLQVQSETFTAREDAVLHAYAGNAFSYEIGCHINDPMMKAGDKYYIIDLIVYGPTSRVAKAWREQFSISSLLKTRNMFMNKKISFRFLGLNRVACSVTKYNNMLNKFTRICEKSTTVNATENPSSEQLKSEDGVNKISLISSYKSSLLKYIMPSKAYLFRQGSNLEMHRNGSKLQRQLSNATTLLSQMRAKEAAENKK